MMQTMRVFAQTVTIKPPHVYATCTATIDYLVTIATYNITN